jgi:hypothetical protein
MSGLGGISLLRKGFLRRRQHPDPVSPELRAALFLRDAGMCTAARLDRKHRCRNQWGDEMRPDFSPGLQVDHVKDEPRSSKRATSDLAHTMLICAGGNTVEHWSSAHREQALAYIRAANRRRAA